MKEKFNIVFFGSPDFACPSLKKLIEEGFKVKAVVTQPDRKKGRNMQLSSTPIKKIAQSQGIKVLEPEKINDKKFSAELRGLKPDLFVVVAYGKILPKEIIHLPTFDSINVHASLLPKLRGASPIQGAILNGFKETGVTIMKMDENMDTGPILAQKKIIIEKRGNFKSLHDKLSSLGAELLVKTIMAYFSHNLKLIKQNHKEATYTKIIKKGDGLIKWNDKADQIERKIRAFNPWPGAYSNFENKKIKIIEAEVTEIKVVNQPGTINFKTRNVYIAAKDFCLLIKKIQYESGQVLNPEQFISGYQNLNNKVLS